MLNRLRRLQISLAAKCQLLFGAAVVLIIAAALAVPWHRFEELTSQLNTGPAEALAHEAIRQHEQTQVRRTVSGDAASSAISTPATQALDATTQPAETLDESPRLLAIDGDPHRELTPFERKALTRFKDQPDSAAYTLDYRRGTNWRFRYARSVFLRQPTCTACHSEASQQYDGKPFGIVIVDMPSRIESNQLLRNRLFILTAGFLAGTLAIVVFYLITTRLILQPVRVLQETAEKVSQGDLNIRSDINTGDEFQQLSETINTMLANLKQSADSLRATNKGLDLKLGQLAEANVALYESNRLKSEFLANVSH